MKEFHAIVSGRVQMVMYRDFARRAAHACGVRGRVHNVPDGTVEVIAQGSQEELDAFITRLKKGPLLARVADVRIEWREPKHVFDTFEIL